MDRLVFLILCVSSACAADPDPGVLATRANGTTSEWTPESSLPTPLANHCAAAVGDHLVVAGGNYRPDGATEFVTSDAIFSAAVEADGQLGQWMHVGTLPGRSQLFSGATTSTASAAIETAGSLGPWTELAPLPEPRTNFRAVHHGDYLYAIGGGNDGPGLDSVWSARVRFDAGE